MPAPKQILKQVRELPQGHQVLFWGSLFMVCWQGMYLCRFVGDSIYSAIEVAVYPPSQCEVVRSMGSAIDGMQPGEVFFSVDMRCTSVDFDQVFVTSPICGGCGPEPWNVLSDEDEDGIFEGKIQFQDILSDEPLVGVGILYRYGISSSLSTPGLPDEENWVSYPENLLAAQFADGGVTCAPVSDGMTYAYRTIDTDEDGSEVRDVFGTCSSIPISDEEWEKDRQAAWTRANPFLAEHVNPWWKPISISIGRMEMADPVLFLTVCTILYIYSIVVIGTGYVFRKEKALNEALAEARHKNTYLEHAAKILRHDMHSGINTYIPRGISSLERRLAKDPECIDKLRLQSPLKMLKEGLAHAQKVYSGVTAFTNLVKAGGEIEKEPSDLRALLFSYLDTTGYKSEVILEDLPTVDVNPPLFCTAIDNLIRNGLKYNDSPSRMVIVRMVGETTLGVMDNGRGMTQEEFLLYSKPYYRKEGQEEGGTGLGLNICIAILHEHGFTVSAEKRPEGGTLIKVDLT